jgi:hypothetical protein
MLCSHFLLSSLLDEFSIMMVVYVHYKLKMCHISTIIQPLFFDWPLDFSLAVPVDFCFYLLCLLFCCELI